MTVRRLAQILGATLLLMTINVAVSVLWVAFYAYVIEPGHESAFYEAHAQIAAPYSSIIAGMPLIYLFGRWVGRWGQREAPMRNAMTLWALYAGIDLAIIGAAGAIGRLAPFVAVSIATKGVAAYLAGRAEQAAGARTPA
ncbi:MAG: hypothetical protein HKO53_01665 [Gemmatimonadetes bacterium]|nr:hypothetical protein [Gemmatimonadota bacterium]